MAYHVSFPTYLIVRRDSVAISDDGTMGLVERPRWRLTRCDGNEPAVPVFTDEDGALTYREAESIADETVSFPCYDRDELADVLTTIQSKRLAPLVAFDARKPDIVVRHVWRIAYVIAQLRKGEDLHEQEDDDLG
jgi:hypothetical protein